MWPKRLVDRIDQLRLQEPPCDHSSPAFQEAVRQRLKPFGSDQIPSIEVAIAPTKLWGHGQGDGSGTCACLLTW